MPARAVKLGEADMMIAGGVDTGWTFYTPYSIDTSTSVISAVLGHASPATTFIYAKADVETLRIAAIDPEEVFHGHAS